LRLRVGIRVASPNWCAVKRTVSFIVLIVSLGFLGGALLEGRDGPAHNQPPVILKINGLGGTDISPSEDVVAATTCLRELGTGPRYSGYLETWDIRSSKILLREPLTGAGAPTASCEAGDVRYSGDGKLLVVSAWQEQLLRVFSAETLKELRTIHVPLHVSEIHVGNSSIPVNWQAEVTGLEVSPVLHLLALRIYRGDYDKHTLVDPTQYLGGFIRVYDLDSGLQINEWEIPTGYLVGGTGLAWRQDGKLLAAAASDRSRCFSGRGTVYLFDVQDGRQTRKLRIPNLAGDLVFGTGDTLYVANGSCAGYFSNRKPRLPIFNAASGNKLGDIEFAGSGIRYNLAVSANRQVLLGYVGREEMRWEFEDTLQVIDQRFAVWDLATHRLTYVSSDLGGHGPYQPVLFTFRLSASGHWAMLRSMIDHNQVWLYPVTAPEGVS
jgi:WD40 repeat protein